MCKLNIGFYFFSVILFVFDRLLVEKQQKNIDRIVLFTNTITKLEDRLKDGGKTSRRKKENSV